MKVSAAVVSYTLADGGHLCNSRDTRWLKDLPAAGGIRLAYFGAYVLTYRVMACNRCYAANSDGLGSRP
jgi:hypothetical protein